MHVRLFGMTAAFLALGAADAGSNAALADLLRGCLLEALPPTLYEASPGWGNTNRVLTGVKWKGKGLHVHPSGQYSNRNNGTWRKVKITTANMPASLAVEVRNLTRPEPGRMTFTLLLGFDARVEYTRQKWASGMRLSDNSARARLRVRLALDCESLFKLQPSGGLLPDAVFRLRVLKADLHYDNVVVEHVAGFGGTTAKVIGEIVLASLKKWHPAIERKFLERANAAIVKAGDTREVRLGLGKLLK